MGWIVYGGLVGLLVWFWTGTPGAWETLKESIQREWDLFKQEGRIK